MDLAAAHQLQPCDVARAQIQIAVAVIGHFDHQHRLLYLQIVQRLAERLSLGLVDLKSVDYDQFAFRQLRSQRRTQGAEKFLARESVVVRPRLRTMHRAAMPPQW